MAPNLSKDAPDEVVVDSQEIPNPSSFALEGGRLEVKGHPFLLDVPSNIVVTNTFSSSQKGLLVPTNGLFVGFHAAVPKSWHAVPIGKLLGIRFMSIFRFKVWWTSLWVGERGREMENETQMVILEKSASGRPYVLLLPLVEGNFRSSLRAGEEDYVELCVESGSTKVISNAFRASLYVHAGDDPYKLVKEAMKVVRAHLGTFRLLEEKIPPGIVDKFGWCTWDAFYLKVHPEGVLEGVQGLVDGGCPPGMVLVDDGWQSICHDDDPITEQDCMNKTVAGEQMPCRLIKFQENYKFRNYQSKRDSPNSGDVSGMGAFVRDLKETFESVEHVYVWHALCGYWGGLRPHVPCLPEAKVVIPKPSPGAKMLMEDLAVDKIVNNGVGMVALDAVDRMYEELHSHLSQAGIDGVKVDVIHLLEMLCEDFGGRVELAKVYYKAISASIKKHFKGNGVIASMEHCNDFMFLGTETISLGRVGDDFWCTDSSGDPNGSFWLQGCHMVHCAYNSLWIGNFIHPDWDMFQSTHPCANFHAASRAISGGPIYISDVVGKHDFDLLKTLVLPDGSILRCNSYALPTRDCLFEDPLHDGKTMLKIWNLNKFSGVLGAFNCQGGGWCPQSRTNKCFSEFSQLINSTVSPSNVEWENGNDPISIEGVQLFATYMYQAKKLFFLKQEETLEISLQPYNFELLTVSPVIVLPEKKGQFAAIGLVNMMNCGGAIQSLEILKGNSVRVGVRGRGEMRAYSSKKPKSCRIDSKEVAFIYDKKMVVIQVPWPNSSGGLTIIEYVF